MRGTHIYAHVSFHWNSEFKLQYQLRLNFREGEAILPKCLSEGVVAQVTILLLRIVWMTWYNFALAKVALSMLLRARNILRASGVSGVPTPPHTKPGKLTKVLGSETLWPPATWWEYQISETSFKVFVCRGDLWVFWFEDRLLLCLVGSLYHRLEHPGYCGRSFLGGRCYFI